MIRDVTSLSRAVRKLDVSSTLRSFAAPGALAFLGLNLWTVTTAPPAFEGAETFVPVQVGLLLFGGVLTIVSMLLIDSAARQPWRPASAGIALATGAGAVTFVTVAALVALGFVIALVSSGSFEVRPADDFAQEDPAALLMLPLFAALFVLYVGVPLWLLRRAVLVETEMAGATPRPVLLGDVRAKGLTARLAYIFGLPSSQWNAAALARPAFWLFLLARALLYVGAWFAIAVIGALTPGVSADPYDSYSFDDPYVPTPSLLESVLIAAAALLAAHILFALAKRLAARRIWAEPIGQKRKPILFLRSFGNDQFGFRRPWHDLVGRWLDLWSFRRNVDELLIDEFETYGPVIAIGRPGDTKTPFGAARRYVSDDDWQRVVQEAAGEAFAIVVCAGDTQGLHWEYAMLRDRGHLPKTIFLFPPARTADTTVSVFASAMGETEVSTVDRTSLVSWRKSADGEETVTDRRATAPSWLAALRSFIQHRAAETGMPVGDRPVSWRLWLGLGIAIVLAALIGLGVFLSPPEPEYF